MHDFDTLFAPLAQAYLEGEWLATGEMETVFATNGAIIYSIAQKKSPQDPFDLFPEAQEDVKYEVIIKEGTVTTRRRHRKHGVSVNGIAWERWKPYNTQIYSFKRKNRQQMPVLHKYKVSPTPGRRARLTNVSPELLARSSNQEQERLNDLVQAMYQLQFPDEEVSTTQSFSELAYPALLTFKQAETPHPIVAHPGLRLHVTQENAREVLASFVGKRYARRDMIRVLKNVPGAVAVLPHAKTLLRFMPVEYVIDIMRTSGVGEKLYWLQEEHYAFLGEHASPQRLKKVLLNPHARIIHDSYNTYMRLQQAEAITPETTPKFVNIRQFHDALVVILNAYWEAANATKRTAAKKTLSELFPETEASTKLQGLNYQSGERSLTIRMPENGMMLYEWGNRMKNCIGSYAPAVRAGTTIVFAVMDGDEMQYNVEVHGGRITQCMVKHNRSAPEAEVEALKNVLSELQILTDSHETEEYELEW